MVTWYELKQSKSIRCGSKCGYVKVLSISIHTSAVPWYVAYRPLPNIAPNLSSVSAPGKITCLNNTMTSFLTNFDLETLHHNNIMHRANEKKEKSASGRQHGLRDTNCGPGLYQNHWPKASWRRIIEPWQVLFRDSAWKWCANPNIHY